MMMHQLPRFSVIIGAIIGVIVAQHGNYYNYYQPTSNDYSAAYQYQYGQQPSYDSSRNYQQESRQNYIYHNLTGYPQHGGYPTGNDRQNEVNVDYYDYYEYETTESPSPPKKDVIISPHPFLVSMRKFFSGLESRQFDLGLGFLSGNTIYLVLSIVLGVIGVGGLVWQFASGVIDEFYKTFDDLKARVSALENAGTTTNTGTNNNGAITTLQTDLAALTTKVADTCAKVGEITDAALPNPLTGVNGDDAFTFSQTLEAIATLAC